MINRSAANGVELVGGLQFRARKEVIISGGAINSPQLLMLSGIGPAKELQRHGIEVVQDIPQVGQSLRDHCFSSAGVVLKQKHHPSDQKQSPSPMGWFKLSNVEKSKELENLSDEMKSYLARPTVPHWELATNTPFFDDEIVERDEEVFSAIALVMNPQSRGTIELTSADVRDAPRIDPKFLSHPYDRRVIVEAMREMLRYFRAPVFHERTVRDLGWPDDEDDESILEQCKARLRSSWHACGTVAMGQDAATACVDSDFKIFGIHNLRVADMSVCPLIPNNHTQSTAYVIGYLAAEKLIRQYML
jgi:choline dehydrogenase-like flavoprotein